MMSVIVVFLGGVVALVVTVLLPGSLGDGRMKCGKQREKK